MSSKQPAGRALITGASSGIGAAFVHILAEEGYELVINSRNIDALNRLAGVLSARIDVVIHTIAADLSQPSEVERLQAELRERNFSPDVVINNAGFGLLGEVLDLSREDQLNMIDLNVRAASDIAMRFLPDMVERGKGGILNVASAAAFMPMPQKAVYAATKSYFHSFSRGLGHEVRKSGVTVMSLCPGPVATGFQERAGMLEAPMIKYGAKASAEDTARQGWDAFKRGQAQLIPGIGTKLAAVFSHWAPRRFLLPSISLALKPIKPKAEKMPQGEHAE